MLLTDWTVGFSLYCTGEGRKCDWIYRLETEKHAEHLKLCSRNVHVTNTAELIWDQCVHTCSYNKVSCLHTSACELYSDSVWAVRRHIFKVNTSAHTELSPSHLCWVSGGVPPPSRKQLTCVSVFSVQVWSGACCWCVWRNCKFALFPPLTVCL